MNRAEAIPAATAIIDVFLMARSADEARARLEAALDAKCDALYAANPRKALHLLVRSAIVDAEQKGPRTEERLVTDKDRENARRRGVSLARYVEPYELRGNVAWMPLSDAKIAQIQSVEIDRVVMAIENALR